MEVFLATWIIAMIFLQLGSGEDIFFDFDEFFTNSVVREEMKFGGNWIPEPFIGREAAPERLAHHFCEFVN